MNYSFTCPFPCNHEIRIDANNHDDAISKIILAGAMSCRNMASQYYCGKANLNLYPIPEEQLRNIVSSQIQAG